MAESISSEQIAVSVGALREEVEAKRHEMVRVADELRRAERELELLIELARLRNGAALPQARPLVASVDSDKVLDDVDGARALVNAAIQALRENGQPMHIQQLTAAVRDAGVAIPGQGQPANLIAHIRTHPEIVRPVRGIYGLREWGLADASPRKSTKRRRRRAPNRTGAGSPSTSGRRSPGTTRKAPEGTSK